MYKKILILVVLALQLVGCMSANFTIKNIDDNALRPSLLDSQTFLLTKLAPDNKYAFHKDYPVNIGFGNLATREQNIEKFLNALQGPNGEKIRYEHLGSCCPFVTKTSELGGGMLEQYQLLWEGQSKPLVIYVNYFEKGQVYIPRGLTAKK